MGHHDDSAAPGMPARGESLNELSTKNKNIIHVVCDGDTHSFDITNNRPKIGSFHIRPGIECHYRCYLNSLFLETKCQTKISIHGSAPDLQNIYVKTNGDAVYKVDDTPNKLRMLICATNILVNSKLSSGTVARLTTFADGKIVIAKDVEANLLILETKQLYLRNANVDVARVYLVTEAIISNNYSALTIGELPYKPSKVEDKIVSEQVAEHIKGGSFVIIEQRIKQGKIEISNAQCMFGSLTVQANIQFYKATIHLNQLLVEAASSYSLRDSEMHIEPKDLKVNKAKQSTALCVHGTMGVFESDVYVNGSIEFTYRSILGLSSAQLCAVQGNISGKVVYLDKPTSLSETKDSNLVSHSRIICSDVVSYGEYEVISAIAAIIKKEKIDSNSEEAARKVLELFTKDEYPKDYAKLPREIIEEMLREIFEAKDSIDREHVKQKIAKKIATKSASAEDAKFKFSRTKFMLAKHTSLKALRDFVEANTKHIHSRDLRSMSVPGDGDCALLSLIINLLYMGLIYDQRHKVVQILSSMYKHKKATSLEIYGKLDEEQFEGFIKEYMSTYYVGFIKSFFNKYLKENSEHFHVIRFMAACARLDVRQHALKNIDEIYNVNKASAHFSAQDKAKPDYPKKVEEAKQQIEAERKIALREFEPHVFLNIEFVMQYLKNNGINTVVRFVNGKPEYNSFVENGKVAPSVTFWASGTSDLDRHFEPGFDLQQMNFIKLAASTQLNDDAKSNFVAEMFAIAMFFNQQLKPLFSTYEDQMLEDAANRVIAKESTAQKPGGLVISGCAEISGDNGHLYTTGALYCASKVVVDRLVIQCGPITITNAGVLDGVSALKLHSGNLVNNNGKMASLCTHLEADYIVTTKYAYVIGSKELDINTLVHVVDNGMLCTGSLRVSSVMHFNLGVIFYFGYRVEAPILFHGITCPRTPYSRNDLFDLSKVQTLGYMGVGFVVPEIAMVVQAVTRTIALAKMVQQCKKLYSELKEKNFDEYTRHERARILKQVMTSVNQVAAFAEVVKPLSNTHTYETAADLMSQLKSEGLRAPMTLNRAQCGANILGAMGKDVSAIGKGLGQRAEKIYNEVTSLEATKETWQQLQTEASTLRQAMAAGEQWLPTKDDLQNAETLMASVDAVKQVSAVFMPYTFSEAIVYVRFGPQMGFTNTAQNWFSCGQLVLSASVVDHNMSVFTHHIGESFYLVYDWHSSSLWYANHGGIKAYKANISTWYYTQSGYTDAVYLTFDVKMNAWIKDHGQLRAGNISGSIGGNFYVDGLFEAGSGSFKVAERIDFSSRSKVSARDLVMTANSLQMSGAFEYSGNVFAEVMHVESTTDVLFSAADGSTLTINSQTENLRSMRGSHTRLFVNVRDMDNERARDLAYQNPNGEFFDSHVRESIRVTTERPENVMYIGERQDGAYADLSTRGGVTLDPTQYGRADGDVFETYNTAGAVAQNYASYKVPPPPPTSKGKRRWQKIGKVFSQVMAGVAAVASATCSGVGTAIAAVASGAAFAADKAVKHSKSSESKRMEAGNKQVLDGQNRINSAILNAHEQSARLSAIEAHVQSTAGFLASGGRMTDMYRAAANDNLAANLSRVETEFATQRNQMAQEYDEQRSAMTDYYAAERRSIELAPGPKVGVGAAVNSGSTGTSISLLSTTGNPNPRNSSTFTAQTPLWSFDNSRTQSVRAQQSEPNSTLPTTPTSQASMLFDESIEIDLARTRVSLIDANGNEVALEPVLYDGAMKMQRPYRLSGVPSMLDEMDYLTRPGYATSLTDAPAANQSNANSNSKQNAAQSTGNTNERRTTADNAARANQDPVEPRHQNALQWLKMAWRSANGDDSADVRAWQQNNRDALPILAEFNDGLQTSRTQQAVNSFADGFNSTAIRPVQFLAEEVARLRMRHQTQTGQLLTASWNFVRQEATSLSLNERTRIGTFAESVGRMIGEDLYRLRTGQRTIIGTSLLREFSSLANAPLNELAHHAGSELGAIVMLGWLGRGLRVGGRARNGFVLNRPNSVLRDTLATNPCESERAMLFLHRSQIDFAPTGFLDGQYYPQNKLPKLYEYLRKRGADIQPMPLGAQGPGFRACDPITGKPTLYLPHNPTVLELKHELSHYLDFVSLGADRYSSLTRLEKESLVLERLRRNRIWDQILNESERDFSIEYVNNLRSNVRPTNQHGRFNIE